MPDTIQKSITPTILGDFFRGRCSYGAFTLDAAETDADETTFTGEVSLDQLADAINEYFGFFPNGHHEVGQCGQHNSDPDCYFCRKAAQEAEAPHNGIVGCYPGCAGGPGHFHYAGSSKPSDDASIKMVLR